MSPKSLKGTGFLGKNTASSLFKKLKMSKSSESEGSDSYSGIKSSYPKEYKDAWTQQEDKYYADYKHYNIEYGHPCDYEKLEKLGRGKYSEVFSGLGINNQKVVMKFLKPVKQEKINREVKIMMAVRDGPNVNKLIDVVKDNATNSPVLITEYMDVSHGNIKDYYSAITPFEVKFYIYKILMALNYVHSKGIMHRDIKPHNVLINVNTRKLNIIDWGLAEFYVPDTDYHPRVASRYFKGPELLVGYPYYHYSLDIWSLGWMLAGIVFKREPFFKGDDNDDQLVKIAKVLGSEALDEYIKKYSIVLPSVFDDILGIYSCKPWEKFVTAENKKYATEEALDLVSQMLVMDHCNRITTTEWINHPYFDEVRDIVESEYQ